MMKVEVSSRCVIASLVVHLLLDQYSVGAFCPTTPFKRCGAGLRTIHLSAQTQTTTDASRMKRISSLTDWAKANEIQTGGVAVEQSSFGGLGLVANKDLPPNSLVVTVPTDMALTVETPGDGPDDRTVLDLFDKKELRDAPWFVQFSAYLNALDLSGKKGDTDMRPWLDSLPRKFDTPIHWSQATRDELQYSHLSDAVTRQETEWKRLYDNLVKGATPQISSKMSFDDFVWGCECARSRVFSGAFTGSAFNPLPYAFTLFLVTVYVGLNLGTLEQAANGAGLVLCASILKDFVIPKLFKKKKYAICPLIDMANHRSLGTTADVSFEFFGDSYSLAVNPGTQVPNGSELFISYGARSNDQLLQYYGFVEPNNPHDVYVMPPLKEWDIDALEKACGRTFAAGRLEKLSRAGLLGSTIVLASGSDGDGAANPLGGVVVSRAGGVDPAVMQALRALVSSDEEWAAAGEAIGNFSEEMAGGVENERLARLAARTALELELASKSTSLEEDEELLKRMKSNKSMDSDAEDTIPVVFRIEKKKLLKEVANFLG